MMSVIVFPGAATTFCRSLPNPLTTTSPAGSGTELRVTASLGESDEQPARAATSARIDEPWHRRPTVRPGLSQVGKGCDVTAAPSRSRRGPLSLCLQLVPRLRLAEMSTDLPRSVRPD